MIKELLYELYTGHRQFVGTGAVLVLFAASVLVLFFTGRGERYKKPLVLSVLGIIAVTAVSAVEKAADAAGKLSSGKKRAACAAGIMTAVICLLAAASSGKSVFSPEHSEKAENDMHIPQYILTAMDAILEDADEPVVAAPYGYSTYFEGFSSRFCLVYDRAGRVRLGDEEEGILRKELESIYPDIKKVASIAHRAGCGYVVLPSGIWPKVQITDCGYELMLDCDGCRVYREVKTP